MNKYEFHDRLKRRAKECYGVSVNHRLIRDWVDENILPKRKQGQYKRQWTAQDYRRALKICRLKSRGIESYSTIRFYLWLGRDDIPIMDAVNGAQEEYSRLRRPIIHKVNSVYTFGHNDFTAKRKSALISQLGEPAPVFLQAGLVPPEDLLIHIYALMRHNQNASYHEREKALLGFLKQFGLENIPLQLLKPFLSLLDDMFIGAAYDDPYDDRKLSEAKYSPSNETEKRIRNAYVENEEICLQVREWVSNFSWLVKHTVDIAMLILPACGKQIEPKREYFRAIADGLKKYPWPIILYAGCLNLALKRKDIADQLPLIISFIAEIKSQMAQGKMDKITLPAFSPAEFYAHALAAFSPGGRGTTTAF